MSPMTRREWLRSALLTLALSLSAVLMTPKATQAYCWWQSCSGPSYATCPNLCGMAAYDEFFYDEFCFEYGAVSCHHRICFWLDNGPDWQDCPESAVCDTSDQWDCADW